MKTPKDIDLRLLKKAIDASASSVVIADAKKRDMPLIFINRAFERITGYTAHDILGRNCRFIQGKDRRQPGTRAIREAIRQHKSCHVLLRNYRKNGELFWNELYLSPVFGVNGELTHYIGVQTDVTARVEAEDKLKQYKTELESMVKKQTQSLEEKNIALKEMLTQLDSEKKALEEKIASNVDSVLLPLVDRLRRKGGRRMARPMQLLGNSLREISSGFGRGLERKLYRLTAREMQVCHLIKQGMTTKDIADFLSTSLKTVDNQRNTIRRKLGILKKNISLPSFLRTI
jgi:PAS domain S-box-containing protein